MATPSTKQNSISVDPLSKEVKDENDELDGGDENVDDEELNEK